tara:strand:+ start:1037 stop:1747 length:711 start_codon:yes stop_codon:yes gene_type:complete
MSIKDKYKVESIDSKETYEWLLHKHYAKRIPSISYAFGLFKDGCLVGVCTYGRPIAHLLIKNSFNGHYQDCFLELNRLCVDDNLDKNTLSYFVSNTIKIISSPKVIVSYADTSQNHNGYIYQATNWIYTGLSAKFKDYMVKGYEHLHGASVLDMVGRSDGDKGHLNKVELLKAKFGVDNVYLTERPRKHRYFYFIGTKKQKKEMMNNLKYEIKPYPKGKNKRYDASYNPTIQTKLF